MKQTQVIKIIATAAQNSAQNTPKGKSNIKSSPEKKSLKNDFCGVLVDVVYGERKGTEK